ncbi:MAG: hypothetical protein AB8B69_20190 [Chitinophagales bacterium]
MRIIFFDFLQNKSIQYLSIGLLFGILALQFNACDRENPCDIQFCSNGECILAVDSVATVEGFTSQTSDTLTLPFRILEEAGTVMHQNKTFTLAKSIIVAPNVEISKTTNISNSTASINILTYTACDCFTGWDGVQCDIPAPCDGRNCLNGGVAVEIDESTCRCDCPLGFTGDLCATEDKCALLTCLNNSNCQINEATGEAECVCDTGFEPPCIVETRNKFLGNYTVKLDSCYPNRIEEIEPYELTVEKDTEDIEQIVFNSFNRLGTILGKVQTDNSISIQDTTDQMDIVSTINGSYDSATKTIDLLLLVTYVDTSVDTCRLVMEQ